MSIRRPRSKHQGARSSPDGHEERGTELRGLGLVAVPEGAPGPEEGEGPPLESKLHPPQEMGFVVPTGEEQPHPHEVHAIHFDVRPDAADAAADLASELGAQYLQGATLGQDVSERALSDADELDSEVPFLLDEAADREEEDADRDEVPRSHRRRQAVGKLR